jgi:hypothetical protein
MRNARSVIFLLNHLRLMCKTTCIHRKDVVNKARVNIRVVGVLPMTHNTRSQPSSTPSPVLSKPTHKSPSKPHVAQSRADSDGLDSRGRSKLSSEPLNNDWQDQINEINRRLIREARQHPDAVVERAKSARRLGRPK